MRKTAWLSCFCTAKSSLLRELFELLPDGRSTDGAAKNDRLMPFDPAPSSFKRKIKSITS